jgi:hypothetical protein
MKVSAIILATVANGQEKKVPPRHPAQRLKRLQQFSEEWMNDNLPFLPSHDAWVAKFKTNAARMTKAFERPTCGYYDPENMPHGGPDPYPEKRPNGGARNRRSDDDEEETYEEGMLVRYDKNNPLTGIKQITTGYRKWAERYINECWGQRKSQFQIKRMNKWFQKLGDHYVATQN